MKKTLNGPNGIRIELDSDEIYPDDPGAGTPVMVYLGEYSGTFYCVWDTGEIECGEKTLSKTHQNWIDKQFEKVDAFVSEHSPA